MNSENAFDRQTEKRKEKRTNERTNEDNVDGRTFSFRPSKNRFRRKSKKKTPRRIFPRKSVRIDPKRCRIRSAPSRRRVHWPNRSTGENGSRNLVALVVRFDKFSTFSWIVCHRKTSFTMDRLFQALFYRFAIVYSRMIPKPIRRFEETTIFLLVTNFVSIVEEIVVFSVDPLPQRSRLFTFGLFPSDRSLSFTFARSLATARRSARRTFPRSATGKLRSRTIVSLRTGKPVDEQQQQQQRVVRFRLVERVVRRRTVDPRVFVGVRFSPFVSTDASTVEHRRSLRQIR